MTSFLLIFSQNSWVKLMHPNNSINSASTDAMSAVASATTNVSNILMAFYFLSALSRHQPGCGSAEILQILHALPEQLTWPNLKNFKIKAIISKADFNLLLKHIIKQLYGACVCFLKSAFTSAHFEYIWKLTFITVKITYSYTMQTSNLKGGRIYGSLRYSCYKTGYKWRHLQTFSQVLNHYSRS